MNLLPLPDDLLELISSKIPENDRFATGYELTIEAYSNNVNGFNLIVAPGRSHFDSLFKGGYEDFTLAALEEAMLPARPHELGFRYTRQTAKRQKIDANSSAAQVRSRIEGRAVAIKHFTSDLQMIQVGNHNLLLEPVRSHYERDEYGNPKFDENRWGTQIRDALRMINPKGEIELISHPGNRFAILDGAVTIQLKPVARIQVMYDAAFRGMLYRFHIRNRR